MLPSAEYVVNIYAVLLARSHEGGLYIGIIMGVRESRRVYFSAIGPDYTALRREGLSFYLCPSEVRCSWWDGTVTSSSSTLLTPTSSAAATRERFISEDCTGDVVPPSPPPTLAGGGKGAGKELRGARMRGRVRGISDSAPASASLEAEDWSVCRRVRDSAGRIQPDVPAADEVEWSSSLLPGLVRPPGDFSRAISPGDRFVERGDVDARKGKASPCGGVEEGA